MLLSLIFKRVCVCGLFHTLVLEDGVFGWSSPPKPTSRRSWLTQAVGGILVASSSSSSSPAVAVTPDELPSFLREYTALAPLGTKQPQFGAAKTLGLSLDELAARLTQALTHGATGQGGYFLTGDLPTDIFRDDCVFGDPTNRVNSLSQYQTALRILFDPARSTVQLVGPLRVVDVVGDTGTTRNEERRISGRLRSRGYLQLPWKPYVTAYETDLVYTVDTSGLISRQDQEWTKSASRALQETFTPSLVDPPARSTQTPSPSEPAAVTQLFDYINGRRPNEYTQDERSEIASLVDSIVVAATTTTTRSQQQQQKDWKDETSSSLFDRSLLPGTWILAYLQPGPDGVGIDRRIPFPDFDFNDSFQVFSNKDSSAAATAAATAGVVNIGQVLGPWVDVQVSGTLEEDDPTTSTVPKRFRANIQGGKLCWNSYPPKTASCVSLPMIQGEGLFDSLYLGERLRIGQNLNGGGARVVQIRLDEPNKGK
jgi:hypothetical protein